MTRLVFYKPTVGVPQLSIPFYHFGPAYGEIDVR